MKKAFLAAVSSLAIATATAKLADSSIQYNITEEGRNIPAKITILGEGKTEDPHFGYKNKLNKEYGHRNAIFSYTGTGTVSLESGNYTFIITRGIEYEPQVIKVSLDGEEYKKLDIPLKRTLDTPGYITGDFHVHANPSPDSSVKLRDRVITAAAEGLEFIVGTDHNKKTDYSPVIKELKLEKFLASSIGDEITTAKLGHINAFPLDPTTPLIGYTPDLKMLFKEIRKDKSNPVIQINHPRFGPIRLKSGAEIGTPYSTFRALRMDKNTRTDDKRYNSGYDALEIFNGIGLPPILGKYKYNANEFALLDYFNLLNMGFRYTAAANSDCHGIIPEVGYPRNFIYLGEDAITPFLETKIRDAVKAHKIVITNGPFIDITSKGENALGLEFRKEARIKVKVSSLDSIKVETFAVFANGKKIMTLPITKDFVKELYFNPKRDTWYTFMAYGGTYLTPLATTDPVEAPFAMTNPIWVDGNGDGKWTSVEALPKE